MKKISQLLLFICVTTLASAQYYYLPYTNSPGQNPGGLNLDSEYPVGGGLTTGWTSIHAGSAATPVWTATQTIPFTFNFNGSSVTQYKVSTSGVLTFDLAAATLPSYTNAAIPNATIPDNSIMVWGIAGSGTNDNIVTKTFGTAPNRQHWIFFTSYTAPGTTCYVYWSIVFEETTNKIYVVDQRNGACTQSVTIGLQYNSTTALSVAGSPNINNLSGTNALPDDNQYYEFNQGVQASFDLTCSNITSFAYLPVGNNNITGIIRNLGTTTINSLTINYTINGGAPVSSQINGLSIAPLGNYTFTHSTPWNSTTFGAYNVSCYATNINGNADQNPGNDSFSKTLNILYSIEERRPLFEVFTGSTCPPCQPGNLNFHNIMDTINPAQHVYIKYQQNFPGLGDPYTTAESTNRRSAFYGINSIPRMENDGGWDGNANSFTYALYQSARAIPAQYLLEGEYTADTVARTFSAKVRYSPLFNATNTNLYTAIIEGTTYLNEETNLETEFYQVMKKMLPDETGTVLNNIAVATWDSVTVTYTFNGNYRLPINGQTANIIDNSIEHSVEEFGDLRMIGWVQSPTGIPKQVFQSANFVKLTSTNVFEMSKNINTINIYPNPASSFANVEISLNNAEDLKIQLMDALGKSIEIREIKGNAGLTNLQFNLSDLNAGIYHIAVTDGKRNSFVKRIVHLK